MSGQSVTWAEFQQRHAGILTANMPTVYGPVPAPSRPMRGSMGEVIGHDEVIRETVDETIAKIIAKRSETVARNFTGATR